jgi:excisionase family DNA binding protein
MHPKTEMRPLAHQLPSAVRQTGISRSLLYQLIKRRELAVVKIGRRTLIADDDLRALIDRYRVGGGA